MNLTSCFLRIPVCVSLTFCGWLKSNWIVLSEGGSEIKEDAAFSFGHSLVPQMPNDILRSHLDVSYMLQMLLLCVYVSLALS